MTVIIAAVFITTSDLFDRRKYLQQRLKSFRQLNWLIKFNC